MNIQELKNKKVGFVALGCAKNTVGLEKMISTIKNFGMRIVSDERDANIMVINSCAFLASTRQEGFDLIKEFSALKSSNLEKIILTGCLPNYRLQDVSKKLAGVDLILTQDRNAHIVEEIAKLYGINLTCEYDGFSRTLTTPNHYAFLRIADGCDNFCSYCTIPYITGRYRSEPIDSLVREAKALVSNGARELILVAQDITTYGKDLYGRVELKNLIDQLSNITDLKRIRLVYCYPEHITDELIDIIKDNDKVCKYIDIPLQHIANNVLKKMNRQNTKENTLALIQKLRAQIPDIQIRTTFILGFPHETEKDFEELCDFVRTQKLNQVGFFAYSREFGTPAYEMDGQIDERTKRDRLARLAEIQYDVVEENNRAQIGKEYVCIADEIVDGKTIMHSQYQMPRDDSAVIVNRPLQIGGEYMVKIVGLDGYDLLGEISK